jgi:CHAD domain-containing protein
MAYRLEIDEAVSAGLRRSAAEQSDRALRELREHVNTDPEDAIHSARKAIKKERSLLRLARGSMSPGARRQENRALRTAARGLSQSRDAEALLGTIDDLAERYAGQLPVHEFDSVRGSLQRRRDAERVDLAGREAIDRAIAELAAVRDRTDRWAFGAEDWDAVRHGLRRSYRDGRRAWHRARDSGSTEDWHGWRKRAKDLWYEQRLLAATGGPAVAGLAKDAHHLADLLGDDHDLAVLRSALRSGQIELAGDLEGLLGLIDHRREQLQSQALALGARIYADRPTVYSSRIRTMWQSGREHAAAAQGQRPDALAQATHAAHSV